LLPSLHCGLQAFFFIGAAQLPEAELDKERNADKD
jgi:hypothetical protein